MRVRFTMVPHVRVPVGGPGNHRGSENPWLLGLGGSSGGTWNEYTFFDLVPFGSFWITHKAKFSLQVQISLPFKDCGSILLVLNEW
jgi:hypothetical protein